MKILVSKKAFTLIELVISLAILTLLSLSVYGLIASSSQILNKQSQIIEADNGINNLKYYITKDIQEADLYKNFQELEDKSGYNIVNSLGEIKYEKIEHSSVFSIKRTDKRIGSQSSAVLIDNLTDFKIDITKNPVEITIKYKNLRDPNSKEKEVLFAVEKKNKEKVKTPQFNKNNDGKITSDTIGAIIYYCLDGENPLEKGQKYDDSNISLKIKSGITTAIAVKKGMLNSDVAVYKDQNDNSKYRGYIINIDYNKQKPGTIVVGTDTYNAESVIDECYDLVLDDPTVNLLDFFFKVNTTNLGYSFDNLRDSEDYINPQLTVYGNKGKGGVNCAYIENIEKYNKPVSIKNQSRYDMVIAVYLKNENKTCIITIPSDVETAIQWQVHGNNNKLSLLDGKNWKNVTCGNNIKGITINWK